MNKSINLENRNVYSYRFEHKHNNLKNNETDQVNDMRSPIIEVHFCKGKVQNSLRGYSLYQYYSPFSNRTNPNFSLIGDRFGFCFSDNKNDSIKIHLILPFM